DPGVPVRGSASGAPPPHRRRHERGGRGQGRRQAPRCRQGTSETGSGGGQAAAQAQGSTPVSANGASHSEMAEVELFADALRAAVPSTPSGELAATLVPRLAAAARTSTIEAETRATRRTQGALMGRLRSRRALAAVVIAVALIPLLVASLAVAGVTVP